MSTNNPFEKLHVKRDKDEEEENFEEVKAKEKNVPIGIKKKKVRPKEKTPEEEEGDEEFQEVRKGSKKNKVKDVEGEEETGNVHKKRRGINYNTNEEREYRENQKPPRGRKFDRQSGTGRGKEIAKGGAGGKYTWNDNPKNIAKDYENYNDDDFFEEALNQENKEKRQRQPRRPKKEDGNDTEENKNESGENQEVESRKREKREEKKQYELKPEEKLEKPEGAIYLEDYLKKGEKPKEEEQKEVKRIQDGKPLTKVEEKKDNILGTSGPGKKKGKKKKEKDVNKQEIDLNAQIGAHLQIGESFERGPRRGGRGGRGQDRRGRGRGRGGRGGHKDEGFVYNPEDFPELK